MLILCRQHFNCFFPKEYIYTSIWLSLNLVHPSGSELTCLHARASRKIYDNPLHQPVINKSTDAHLRPHDSISQFIDAKSHRFIFLVHCYPVLYPQLSLRWLHSKTVYNHIKIKRWPSTIAHQFVNVKHEIGCIYKRQSCWAICVSMC